MKIWDWIKAIVLRLLRRTKHETSTTGTLTELDRKLGQKIQRRREKMGRPVDTRQGGPNMPKYQPCTCGRWVKRNGKTMNGAHYWCAKCKLGFFVRAK